MPRSSDHQHVWTLDLEAEGEFCYICGLRKPPHYQDVGLIDDPITDDELHEMAEEYDDEMHAHDWIRDSYGEEVCRICGMTNNFDDES